MKTSNWSGFKMRMADTRGTTPPARRYLSSLLPLLAISLSASLLSASLVEAQAPGPRASAATAIAVQRLQVAETELRVVNETQVGDFNRVKVTHPRTGRIEVVNLDAGNREVPRERVEQVLAARRQADFRGKQERELAERVAGRPATELTTVLVWGRLPGPPPRIERPGAGAQAAAQTPAASAQTFREFNMNATRGLVEHARGQGWTVLYQAKDAPVVILSVPNGQLQALEARGDVEAIYLGRVYRDELNVSAPAIDAGTVWGRGFTGTGVSVAVVEGDGIYFGHSNLADGTYCNPVADSPVGAHASGVAGIIASTHATYKGVAHGAPALLSGNAKSYSDADIIACTEWAVDQGAKVINYSFGSNTGSAMAGLDRYVDYVVRNRYVTVVKAAGNRESTCFSPEYYVSTPGKGWNILTVGNYNDGGTASNANDVMSTSSCYGDPASPNGDREKPEVAAPGTSITTTYCTSPNTCTATASGTSFAAPHVVGCAALLMHRSVTLTAWPEAVRAILMASAVVNLEGDARLSEQDGTGGIECDSADDIVRGMAGGEQHGVFVNTDFPKTFTLSTAAGRTVRVVIAWDSTTDQLVGTTAPASDALKADLDLEVTGPNGTYVAGSYSWDNSYEIVEFTASATGTYTARISAPRFEGDTEFLAFAWWNGTREK
jgi:hypothetical protein